jgi:phage tail-like protein
MRVEFDHQTYLHHLPAIYRNNVQCGDFLARFVSLFESFFGDMEAAISTLPGLFDPTAVPEEFLPWLAGWLALELDEDWDEEAQRKAIAEAFERYAQRGTVEGLRHALHLSAGVNAVIQEPILNAAWWGLPAMATPTCPPEAPGSGAPEASWQATEDSILGFTTMLAPAHAQGAVVGTTATLDQSHLITNEDFGVPLFEDVAHQFSVQVYRGQVKCAETLPQVRVMIEREKPAHTSYHLCILEPRMRIGFQARVGIDTVVAGPLPAMMSGEVLALGQDTVLGGQPPARVGEHTTVGPTARVG